MIDLETLTVGSVSSESREGGHLVQSNFVEQRRHVCLKPADHTTVLKDVIVGSGAPVCPRHPHDASTGKSGSIATTTCAVNGGG
jgi:hypothetical protein